MEYLEKLEKSLMGLIEELKEEFSKIRTNRPTPKLIENVPIEYQEQSFPVKQLGSIMVEPPRSILVTPWDKESIPAVARGIDAAKLGVAVAVQGNIIRVTLPELTGERREELSRIVRKIAEDVRIKMRIMRDDVHKTVKAESDEDIVFRNKEKLQKIVDTFNNKVDELVEVKLNELAS